jgi:hypothetical protein
LFLVNFLDIVLFGLYDKGMSRKKIRDRSGLFSGVLLFVVVALIIFFAGHKKTRIESVASTGIVDVLLVSYNPIVYQDKKASEFYNWRDHQSLGNNIASTFNSIPGNRADYNIVSFEEIDKFPIKSDGYQYTPYEYWLCNGDSSECHSPDIADYYLILEEFNVCERFNSGEFDELWLVGGPYFGFYESRLAGPNSFWYNSPGLSGTECSELLPIMGFNSERGVAEALHNWGHRLESTMTRVYGSTSQNSLSHEYNQFQMNAAQSPDYSYSGCGSAHYPPNGQSDYDYGNSSTISSYCNEFDNGYYGSVVTDKRVDINCSAWGCSQLGYFQWWFSKVPDNTGAQNGISNNWWNYILDPDLVYYSFEDTEPPPDSDGNNSGNNDGEDDEQDTEPTDKGDGSSEGQNEVDSSSDRDSTRINNNADKNDYPTKGTEEQSTDESEQGVDVGTKIEEQDAVSSAKDSETVDMGASDNSHIGSELTKPKVNRKALYISTVLALAAFGLGGIIFYLWNSGKYSKVRGKISDLRNRK